MMDPYLRFVNGVQALRRRAEGLSVGMGGALGVAADPLPHQLATVRRVLADSHIRHLLADEVGLGKTVQALMIVNALRWQDPAHRTLIVAPDNLLAQWQEECWARGHVMPAFVGAASEMEAEAAPILLVRPRELTRPQEDGERALSLSEAAGAFDLLLVDEPQTMSRDAAQTISTAADKFRQVLVLSATPRLGDAFWREIILRMIEPEAAYRARREERPTHEVLAEREEQALEALDPEAGPEERAAIFLRAASGRRVIRNGRKDWGGWLPLRRNAEIRVAPLEAERARHEIAARLLEEAAPSEDLQGRPWPWVRALQRSARAARAALAAVTAEHKGTELAAAAEAARLAALEDPGDSRLEALIDILAEEWEQDPAQAFVVVCGDNPTIDMLGVALPRYFPDLGEEGLAELRRPAAGEEEAVSNLREAQETLSPFLNGDARLLLVGDWVQAGLNLHHASNGIIFYSLPWELDGVDQLIGRVDRLDSRSKRRNAREVRIWRITQEDSQEAAVAECAARLGVFDAPLPPFSDEDRKSAQATLAQAARRRKASGGMERVDVTGASLPTRLAEADPFTPERAKADYEVWRRLPAVEPTMHDPKNRDRTPVDRSETALKGWLEIISRSADFDLVLRRDQRDEEVRFGTLWHHRPGGGGRPVLTFSLPETGEENWMSDHQPYLFQRRRISSPPRKTVVSDAGEGSGRPLHFLDHGSRLHDALVAGYLRKATEAFGLASAITSVTAIPPLDHPAQGSWPVLITAALLDPFPDEALPPLWTPAALEILASAPTEAQRDNLSADRRLLRTMMRALQRWTRLNVPAELLRIGSAIGPQGWSELPEARTDAILRPLRLGANEACMKGRPPTRRIPEAQTAEAERQRQSLRMEAAARRFGERAALALSSSAGAQASAIGAHWEAEAENRARSLARRKEHPPETGSKDMWSGQVAALERGLAMARLCGVEALAMLEEIRSGGLRGPPRDALSLFIGFAPPR